MKNHLWYCFAAAGMFAATAAHAQLPEKTSFQASAPWRAAYDVRSDIAMVYGMDSTFEQRVAGYRERGYNVQFMTGVAWGEYKDYFRGQYDGKTHWEESQTQRNGDVIGHGKEIPYVVPTDSYIAYFKHLVRRAIDAGITTIYLEEPEFWARAGYSSAFKSEWQKYYGFAWMPQHESPEATYLSSKLKYHLYFKALKEIFSDAKKYGDSLHKPVHCYVPTHSLLNYSSWQIVSPEASLASLQGMDGYIAQVWTGTAREPNYYNGIKKERVFETAFLEYGSMLSMTAPTKRRVYFLTDPIEDWPRTWDDYRKNYEATFTAELLYPEVTHFEVMPWPNRIYLGKFKLENNPQPQPISPDYATQMQVMVNALNTMPASGNTLNGTKGIGVLAGNSMMFQRFPAHDNYQDPQLSNFYGMILPLLKKGVPVETVHMENLGYAATLQHIQVLVMSYANMKPLSPDVNVQLAQWVKNGGELIYFGRDNDPFQQVREWWNTGDNHYTAPSQHLFQQLQVKPGNDSVASYSYGKGHVYLVRKDPKELVLTPGADNILLTTANTAVQRTQHHTLQYKNNFVLRRGPYVIAAVMDETAQDSSLTLHGRFIDLFDPALPVVEQKNIQPNTQAFLYDVQTRNAAKGPAVLASACRVYEEKTGRGSYAFVAKSPTGTNNVMRIQLPAEAKEVTVTNAAGTSVASTHEWDAASHTLLLRFVNDADGVKVEVRW
ncbi:hypothetical protein [Deminuibacter soli]|uniref:Beta-galactosidase trimerisation domain-containing protein n=1 Tax=Deminuibacter soli TaxID=2291815 RepID=A0A3E1NLV7_9BACT|nr:hypothetical protein [Deminuibacter soli]RFM28916.1 hypothetical protein DXN05_09110 [Deminuibacter soli]